MMHPLLRGRKKGETEWGWIEKARMNSIVAIKYTCHSCEFHYYMVQQEPKKNNNNTANEKAQHICLFRLYKLYLAR